MKKILGWIAAAFLGICVLSVAIGVITSTTGDDKSDPPVVAVDDTAGPGKAAGIAATSAAPKAKPTTKAQTIIHPGVWHVGEDVPPGRYRAATTVEDGCYWEITKDAEAQDIVANGAPTGGRPQFTLKNGQWFDSHDCGDWVKQ